MALIEANAVLKATQFDKVIFILDASESAAQHQSAIISLVQATLSNLPAGIECEMYFLGNSISYPLRNFSQQAVKWFYENRQRTSLITPIFEAIVNNDSFTLVVIGSGLIFDLEDWEDSPIIQRANLVNMGEPLQGKMSNPKEMTSPTAEELLRQLHNPTISVEITAEGFMPTLWDNPGYHLNISGGKTFLRAKHLEDYSITLIFFAVSETEISAIMTRANGEKIENQLKEISTTSITVPITRQLNAEETKIFSQAICKEDFTCIYCGHLHPWNTLRCHKEAIILGEIVYPSLRDVNTSGFVVFHKTGDKTQIEIHHGNVLRLGFGEVAVKDGQKAPIYGYNEESATWTRGDLMKPYCPLGEDKYAIFI